MIYTIPEFKDDDNRTHKNYQQLSPILCSLEDKYIDNLI